MIFALSSAVALEPAADEPEVSETVIVYAEEEVRRAREEVVRELRRLGYEKRIERDGAIVLRHPDTWRGEVWLHDDGWVRIRRQPLQIRAPATRWSRENSAGAWASCILLPFRCVRSRGLTVSQRKFRAVESRTAEAIAEEVAIWADRVADRELERRLEALPERLAALWERGTPLDGGPVLPTPRARKEALLRFWETRTETPWGEAVRRAVESFVRAEVQTSEHPFTEKEIAAFNRRSRASRPFDLERR